MNAKWLFMLFPVLSMTACVSGDDDVETENYVVVGDKVPEFRIEDYLLSFPASNGFDSPEGFIGRKSLFVFMNTKCGDCKREMPYVHRAWEELGGDNGLQVVPAGRRETYDAMVAYWDEHAYGGMPLYVDEKGEAFAKFANQTIPRIYLVDAEGKVVWMAVEKLGYGNYTEANGDKFVKLIKEKLNL